jgi:hypothetical protein
VATKKQQRRRAKERRHEYEVVYVDEHGNEVEPPPEEEKPKSAAADRPKQQAKAPARSRSGRPMREVKPPSWRRVFRRALLFAPFLFIALSFGKHPPAIGIRLLISIGYTLLFVPTFYWIDRFAYRRYQRTLGQPPAKTAKKS